MPHGPTARDTRRALQLLRIRMWDTLHTTFDRSSGWDTIHSRQRWEGQVRSVTATCGRDYRDDRRSNKLS